MENVEKVENVLLTAIDPISLAIFVEPLCLVPCGHSLEKKSAMPLYDLTENLQMRKPGTCPTCRGAVVACVPNHSLRQLLTALVSHGAPPLACTTIKLAEEARPVVAFPGKSARFEVARRWQRVDEGSNEFPLCVTMKLRSATARSLLNEVCVFGYRDGSIVFRMSCRLDASDSFKKYVSDSGFQPHYNPSSFYARQPNEKKWVLSVLADHNEVPQAEFELMKSFVETNQ